MKTALFWTLATIDACTVATLVWFFLVGIGDGTVSGNNALLWLAVLAAPIGLVWFGFHLRHVGRVWSAVAVLAILSAPALFGALLLAAAALNPGSFR